MICSPCLISGGSLLQVVQQGPVIASGECPTPYCRLGVSFQAPDKYTVSLGFDSDWLVISRCLALPLAIIDYFTLTSLPVRGGPDPSGMLAFCLFFYVFTGSDIFKVLCYIIHLYGKYFEVVISKSVRHLLLLSMCALFYHMLFV